MTKKGRLLAAYRGQKPDMVPVSAFHWSVCQRLYGCFCWMHELRLAKELGWDPHIRLNTLPKPEHIHSNYIYNVGSGTDHQYHGFYQDLQDVSIILDIKRGKDITYITRKIKTPAGDLQDRIKQPQPDTGYGWLPMPHYEEKLIKGKDDLEKIKYLLNAKLQRNRIEDAKEIIKYVGEDGLVTTTIYSPLDYLAGDACPQDYLLTLYYDDTKFLCDILKVFQEYCLKSVKPYLEMGVQVVFMSWFYTSFSAGWSPQIWEEMFLPLLKEQVDYIHSYGAMCEYYDDGKIKKLLPYLKQVSIDALSTLTPPPVGDVTLKEAKEYFQDKVTLKGGLDAVYILQKGTPKDIENAVCEDIESAGSDGRYILFPSDPIPHETPFENIHAFVEAGRKYGRY